MEKVARKFSSFEEADRADAEYFRALTPQQRLDIQLGQKLPDTVDAWPGRTFEGEVTFVSRQAEFTPSNVQTYDERARQVFRIKVALQAPDDPQVQLYPGMTADVYLGEAPHDGP